jgi:hypothetical protein
MEYRKYIILCEYDTGAKYLFMFLLSLLGKSQSHLVTAQIGGRP